MYADNLFLLLNLAVSYTEQAQHEITKVTVISLPRDTSFAIADTPSHPTGAKCAHTYVSWGLICPLFTPVSDGNCWAPSSALCKLAPVGLVGPHHIITSVREVVANIDRLISDIYEGLYIHKLTHNLHLQCGWEPFTLATVLIFSLHACLQRFFHFDFPWLWQNLS